MFNVEIHGIKNATPQQKAKFQFSADQLADELNKKSFWDEVKLEFIFWKYKNGFSFDEFQKYVLSGRDKFNDIPDGDLDVYVTFYYSWRSVVGYTTPRTWFTWINRKFFNKFDDADIAGNIAHEYLHNLGFDHPNADRDSLVYKFGNLVRDRIRRRRVSDGWFDDLPSNNRVSLFQKFKRFFTRLFR